MVVPEKVLAILRELARNNPSKECCGVLTTDFELCPVPNDSPTPQQSFVFAKREYVSLLADLKRTGKEILAIYHTHPGGDASPSKADLKYSESARVNSLIVSTHDWRWIEYAD